MYKKGKVGRTLKLSAFALLFAVGSTAWAEGNDLPAMGGDQESASHTDVTYENHTAVRQYTGLSKFRNTLQAETDKQLSDGWALHSILRGSWDGVYQFNQSHYGKTAGGSIMLGNINGPNIPPLAGSPYAAAQVPQGGGIGSSVVTGLGIPGNVFHDGPYASNPNSGLVVLGESTYGPTPAGDVAFGVPVRPCDVDSRGCRNFGGYGNLTQAQLAGPEFDDHLDFIRELYVKKNVSLDNGKEVFVKLGRQQVVWGRTDLFRVLDVLNPVDYSRNNIYDELSDIRIPMFMLQTEYRMGPSDSMQDRNLQLVWNFDKFRPNDLGQCGTPNVILGAGCFFRGMANLWDNGGTVANFAAGGTLATNFGPNQIGIRNVELPGWSLNNTQLGAKFEGVSSSGLSFSLNALTTRSQLPSLHSINSQAINPFTGLHGNGIPISPTGVPGSGVIPPVSNLIAFDMYFPRVELIGGSMDFQLPNLQAAVRMEGALTKGEEFANTSRAGLYSENNVFRSVVGFDRPTFIPFISETSATLISTQIFYQHIFNHELSQGPLGQVGMPDWQNNFIMTMLFRGTLKNGLINPQVIFARDFQATANVIAPQVEWNVTNTMKLTFGANYKFWSGSSNYRFDDCRSCNPYAPFTAGTGQLPGQSAGLSSVMPLGIFRAGPIGAAFNENDLFFRMNYKF